MRCLIAVMLVAGTVLSSTAAQERSGEPRTSGPLFEFGEMGDFARVKPVIAPAVYYVGHPNGSGATAFCINAKARLLATAAHVADIRIEHGDLYAVRNDTKVIGKQSYYRVERVWYHHSVPRLSPDKDKVVVHGLTPGTKGKLNKVWPSHGFDVAILQLEGHERGRPLPAEIPLPKKGSLDSLIGWRVGSIGFPGQQWPRVGDRLCAVFGEGMVSKDDGNIVRDSIAPGIGRSGAPVFSMLGELVGLFSYNLKGDVTPWEAKQSHSMHVDALLGLVEGQSEIERHFASKVLTTSPSGSSR